jgi:lysyl-tRNA synthetase class I
MDVNSLNQESKERLKGVIRELNDSMTRVSAEKDLQKESIDKICEDLSLDKKIVRRMAKVYYKSNFNQEVEQDKAFEDFYSIVVGTSIV